MSINSQNFALAVSPLSAMASTVDSTGTTHAGVSIDLESTAIGDEVGFLLSSESLGTAATIAWKVQASADGTNWCDIPGASITKNAAGIVPVSIGRSLLQRLFQTAISDNTAQGRYVRVYATVTVGATIKAIYTPFCLVEAPYASKVAGTDYIALGN